jgi:L-Ala-D/L-Glu epimerase
MDLIYAYQEWPYREVFRISRSDNICSKLFVAWVRDGDHFGRGECSVLDQYGHTPEDVADGFEDAIARLASNPTKTDWLAGTENTSVRNALDCALWDLECKRTGKNIWELTGVQKQQSIEVDLTISVNPTEKMCADARRAAAQGYRLLKLKSNGDQVLERVSRIAKAVPGARFIVDANESWSLELLRTVDAELASLGVVLIEQPLHHLSDEPLAQYRGPIPICADESCHAGADFEKLAERYQAINIKLDKVGGLTPGLALARLAKSRGMGLMMGCGGPTSLGVAPAYIIGTLADFVDLDGPALMLDDRAHPMTYKDGYLHIFSPDLWG